MRRAVEQCDCCWQAGGSDLDLKIAYSHYKLGLGVNDCNSSLFLGDNLKTIAFSLFYESQ